jgi:hypothetical protein
MPNLTKERLQEIADKLKNLPTIRRIEREAGLPQSTFNQLASGKMEITEERAEALAKVIEKYNL